MWLSSRVAPYGSPSSLTAIWQIATGIAGTAPPNGCDLTRDDLANWIIARRSTFRIAVPARPALGVDRGAESRRHWRHALDDPRRLVAPVPVAEQPLVELAGRKSRQLGLEIDRARHLLARQRLAAERDQFVGKFLARFDAWHRLHYRLHLFAEVGIGNAEHRGIGNLRMGDQQVFAFLRVDIDPAGDDHEGRAVGEIEIAVGIDIADVADRAHAAVRRARLAGAARIVEIFERRCRLEPHRTRRAGRALLKVLIENMEVTEQHLADGALVGEPLLAVAGGEA